MAQVEADPAGEAARLRPRLGHVAPGRRARDRRDHPAVHAEARVELADVVQQRGREPRAGRRRTGVPASAACTSRATPIAWRWSWLGWRGTREAVGREHRLRPTRRRRRAARPGDSAPHEATGEVQRPSSARQEHEVEEPVLERVEELADRRRSRTRAGTAPGSRTAGTGTSAGARPRAGALESAEPSSGGIGRRLNSPRNRFTSANENRIWMPSGRSAIEARRGQRRRGRTATAPRARRRP